MPSLYDKIGPETLRAVIVDFYARVFEDPMIGFLFIGKDRQRLIDKEFEFTANLLGGDVRYTGRPIKQAHARVPIMGGHFDRRLQILREALAQHDVDADVQERWIAHSLALRAQVTRDAASQCNDPTSPDRFTRDDPPR